MLPAGVDSHGFTPGAVSGGGPRGLDPRRVRGSSWTIRSRGHAVTGMSRKPTRGPRRSTGSSSRVRFLGSESDKAHGRWFRVFAEHYDTLAAAIEPRRTPNAATALHRLFRRRRAGPRILEVAGGSLFIGLRLLGPG